MVDTEIKIQTTDGPYLLEFADEITVSDKGNLTIAEDIEIQASNACYLLQKGDKILLEDTDRRIITLIRRMQGKIIKAMGSIKEAAKVADDQIKKELYKKVLESREWKLLEGIVAAKSADEIERNIIARNVDPQELIAKIAQPLLDAGEKTGKVLTAAVKQGWIGKAYSFIKDIKIGAQQWKREAFGGYDEANKAGEKPTESITEPDLQDRIVKYLQHAAVKRGDPEAKSILNKLGISLEKTTITPPIESKAAAPLGQKVGI
jgi:hypothetical protein